MTNRDRRITLSLVVLATMAPVIIVYAGGQDRPAAVAQMAKAYGLDEFGQIEKIRYTFNIEFPGVSVTRSWQWEPKTGEVTYEGPSKSGKPVRVTYQHTQMASQSPLVKTEVDPGFINDQYWLIFPFHAAWDTGAKITDEGNQKLALGPGSARRIVVKYPPESGGYTPGDTWELHVGDDHRVQELVFRRGGTQKPSEVIVTWEGYKKAGPLLVSTEHHGTADGKPLHLWLTDVSVKVTGSDTWMDAQ